ALRAHGVPYVSSLPHSTPVPSPVELVGPVGGVWFRMLHDDRPLTLSCELATRLPALAKILRKYGIEGVDVISSYRDQPFSSFHTLGLALDLSRFFTGTEWLSVEEHFLQ